MQTLLGLAALLLCCSRAHTNPVSTGACTLQPISLNSDVQVSYTTSRTIKGCVSNSTVGKDREVHVLNVKSLTKDPFLHLSVSLERKAPERKVVLAIYSSKSGVVSLHSWPFKESSRQDSKQNGIVRAQVLIFEDGTEARQGNAPLSDNSEELVKWAVTTYGGITSYTELENPRHILFHLGEDASSPPDCHPQAGFNARHYLEAELLSSDVKTCTTNEMKEKEKEAHILWVRGPEDPSSWVTEVNVDVSCQNGEVPQNLQRMLILQSQPNMSWLLSLQQDMQIMASGNYTLRAIPIKVAGNNLPNTEQGLINRVLEMNYSIIASYLDIPSASNVTIRIQKCAPNNAISTTTATGQSVSLESKIRSELNLMKPWKCTNDSIKIVIPSYLIPGLNLPVNEVTLQDSNCKATNNGSQFVLMSLLEKCSTVVKDGIHVTNKLILTLVSPPQKIQVPFVCQIPVQDREMSLQLFHDPEFTSPSTTVLETNKVAYVQVQLRTKDKPELEQLECQLELAAQKPLPLVKDNNPWDPTVKILQPPEPTLDRKTQRFSFIYSPGEHQQAPPTAILLCRIALQYNSGNSTVLKKALKVTLQDSKLPPQNPGLGMGAVLGITFGAFLIGALLTAALWYIYSHTRPTAKMQPVSVNPPASESSSTSHSIGSTQSTPCSNSSMA